MKRTVATIRLLRTVFNCDLDIEIWHLEKEAESVGTFQKEIDELRGIKLRDFSDFYLSKPISRSFGSSKQFQIKAAAIINSDFQHVLYLDSDNVPTRDPTYLFESREYMEYGAIFWPDFWKTDPENKIFRILEVECEDEWEQESGQIVVDKHRHWMPLQLTWYMQFFHDVYFRLLNGDKDTFQYAWRALKVPFYRVQTFVGMGGLMIGNHDPIERPWRLIKRYVNDVSNTQLYPLFKMVNDPRNNITVGCMDFPHRSDENIPTYILPFDKVLPHFQKRYLESGGVGGK
ncbi:mannosyltransferase putative-domain-containing protein [Pilobolus umbonatus]|nr:mannosyltransferase putative-domain-containing protein [Pilobolus umbonatus]